MKHFLLVLFVLLCVIGVALAEQPLMTVSIEGQVYRNAVPVQVQDAAFVRWMQDLLAVDAPCDAPQVRPSNNRYRITFRESGETWSLWHDDLYNLAVVTRPDGTNHAISPDVPQMLNQLCLTETSFDIPAEHCALLAEHGWTVAYRHPHDAVRLPDTLAASRTDAAALHFTYADLFLRAQGFDITPWLGKTVQPHVYALLEQKNRIAWKPEDIRLLDENGQGGVLYSLYAVVLEYEGQVIGAYLRARSWDGTDLMTLDGQTAVTLLADSSIRAYLLERLPFTEQERALAALSPEEALRRYAQQNDPALRPVDAVLSGTGTASALLYPASLPGSNPTGSSLVSIRAMEEEGRYEVKLSNGWAYYPAMVYESPETGWKVSSFYNTGY